MTKVLIVEDNPDLAFGLRRTLEFEGFQVEIAENGRLGLERARAGDAELVLLDLMLPEMDGFRVLRELRGGGSRVPVLVLTARGDESDIVMGFDSGADDYVTKPFSTLELLARVRALLRRGPPDATDVQGDDGPLGFGDVEVDPEARTVFKGGQAVSLTPKEFDLLLTLIRRRGGVASRSDLLDEVWRYANSEVMTRTVDTHVAELRRKLEDDPAHPEHILTVRKAGYRLEV
jgi:DNA-binding response OmpR family regulator